MNKKITPPKYVDIEFVDEKIEFGMFLSGHDQKSVEQLYEQFLREKH